MGSTRSARAELRQVFVQLKDERGAVLVARQLTDNLERSKALAALKQMGPQVARQALLAYANHADAWVSDTARQQLMDWGVQVAPKKVEPPPVGWNTNKAGAVSTNTLGMKFAYVPRGSFWMGGGNGKAGDKEVTIPHDFFLGVYEVTQKEWLDVMGDNPSYFSRKGSGSDKVKDIPGAELAQFPVENVSWNMIQDYLQKLNAKEKDSGWMYRLPTEAEWEYACRGGSGSKQESAFDYYFTEPTNRITSDDANFGNENELRRHDEGGVVQAESSGAVRHARQRLGVD